MELKEGMKVEARYNEEGFSGAWVEGIVGTINGEDCIISLNKLVRDKGKSSVEVSVRDVRPIPPYRPLPRDCLDGVAVEAKGTDCWCHCWCPGFIVRQILCDGRKLWLISFPNTKILMAYPLSLLRPAQEWRGGEWTLVPQETNLNIGQVIRVLSANNSDEEITLKSSNHYEASQGCTTKKRNRSVNTKYSSSAGYQMGFRKLKRMCLEEKNQYSKEAQNAKEGKEMEVKEIEEEEAAKEDEIEVENVQEAKQEKWRHRDSRPILRSGNQTVMGQHENGERKYSRRRSLIPIIHSGNPAAMERSQRLTSPHNCLGIRTCNRVTLGDVRCRHHFKMRQF